MLIHILRRISLIALAAGPLIAGSAGPGSAENRPTLNLFLPADENPAFREPTSLKPADLKFNPEMERSQKKARDKKKKTEKVRRKADRKAGKAPPAPTYNFNHR